MLWVTHFNIVVLLLLLLFLFSFFLFVGVGGGGAEPQKDMMAIASETSRSSVCVSSAVLLQAPLTFQARG